MHGYLPKSADAAQVTVAFNTVLCDCVFAPAALTQARRIPAQPVAVTTLTGRQREVFDLMSQGFTTKTIARHLGLAVGTVKVHLAAIYRLLGAQNRIEAAALLEHGSGMEQQVRGRMKLATRPIQFSVPPG
jgi:DNA-binding NarL/FixJ family response regulator